MIESSFSHYHAVTAVTALCLREVKRQSLAQTGCGMSENVGYGRPAKELEVLSTMMQAYKSVSLASELDPGG